MDVDAVWDLDDVWLSRVILQFENKSSHTSNFQAAADASTFPKIITEDEIFKAVFSTQHCGRSMSINPDFDGISVKQDAVGADGMVVGMLVGISNQV